jgi:predicted ATPase with chaperone activity
MQPCSRGYYRDLKQECRCSPTAIQKYRQSISGPLLDRIDLHVEVPAVESRHFHQPKPLKVRRRFVSAWKMRAPSSASVLVQRADVIPLDCL